MLLGFKTKLKLNNQQRTQMAKHAGVARHAWNWGLGLTKQILDDNQNNPEEKIKFPSAIDLHKWLVALVKPECPWYYESSKCAPQFALRCQLYGSELIIADRWLPSSKTCSSCGNHNSDLTLSDRIYNCNSCGVSLDRDWNAAINLSRWSHHQTAVRPRSGFPHSRTSPS